MKTFLGDCSHCPNLLRHNYNNDPLYQNTKSKTKSTTKLLQLSSCSLIGRMRENKNNCKCWWGKYQLNPSTRKLEAFNLEYAELLTVTSLFDHNKYSMLQQWWVRKPQVSVGIVLIKHIQFLQALAVQCGLVLRGSDQIPECNYCIPRCLVGEVWPGQPVTGETDRPRKRRSMEGRRGFRRLTGQKAEPPWGVKLTLLGSGQDGWRKGSSWQADLGGGVKRWRE